MGEAIAEDIYQCLDKQQQEMTMYPNSTNSVELWRRVKNLRCQNVNLYFYMLISVLVCCCLLKVVEKYAPYMPALYQSSRLYVEEKWCKGYVFSGLKEVHG